MILHGLLTRGVPNLAASTLLLPSLQRMLFQQVRRPHIVVRSTDYAEKDKAKHGKSRALCCGSSRFLLQLQSSTSSAEEEPTKIRVLGLLHASWPKP